MSTPDVRNFLGVDFETHRIIGVGPLSVTEVPGQKEKTYAMTVLSNGNMVSIGTDNEEEAQKVRDQLYLLVARNSGERVYHPKEEDPTESFIVSLDFLRYVGPVELVDTQPERYGFTLGMDGGTIRVADLEEKVAEKQRKELLKAWS